MSQACDGEHLQIQLCVGPMSVICGMTINFDYLSVINVKYPLI